MTSPRLVAHSLRRELIGSDFLNSPWQWGDVNAVHTAASTTLAAAASAGATSVSTTASVGVNAMVFIGTEPAAIRVTAVSGTGPYAVTLATALTAAQASGATVSTLATVDLYLDGSTTLTTGVRYLGKPAYSPATGDVVLVARRGNDRVVLGALA